MRYEISEAEIIAIRDAHLPSQGEQFDCIAFARAIIAQSKDALAGRLIDAWCDTKGKQIPWATAVKIIAIVTGQSDEERDRLLALGDEDDVSVNEIVQTIRHGLEKGFTIAELLDENSPIRDRIRDAIANAARQA